MRSGPLILVEDDEDDQLFLRHMVQELKIANQLRVFSNGQEGLDYLCTTHEQPFLILCDINMPVMNGLELRRHIQQNPVLRQKAVPFVFLTTSDAPPMVEQAYAETIQGYFKKASTYEQSREQLGRIVDYWQHCLHPNNT